MPGNSGEVGWLKRLPIFVHVAVLDAVFLTSQQLETKRALELL